MAQANWQIEAQNTSISKRSVSRPLSHKRRTWQFPINVTAGDANRLKEYMGNELHYYNTLYNSFAPRAKTFPESLGGITDKHEQVFLAIAETGFRRIGQAARKKDIEFPPQLEKYRDFIQGKNDANIPNIGDREDVMFGCAAEPAMLVPEVRKRMAKEFLEFYKTQAKLYLQKVPSHLAEEQAFKTAPETLEPLDNIRKRHLQIPRDVCKVEWDEEKEISKIITPYISTPFIVNNLNLVEMKGWNYIIIHQEPGRIPITSTPWMIDIRSIQNRYMLKYVDVLNPNASTAFNLNKSGARKK